MPGWLRRHPFAVEAFFDRSIVLTYAFAPERLRKLVPACLTLDTFQDGHAFVAVAMVQTRSLRPKGFPRLLGHDFLLVGYRVFVRHVNEAGKKRRGLYILKSETNRRSMQVLGNLFTRYRYARTDVRMLDKGSNTTVRSDLTGLSVTVDRQEDESLTLPTGSPFDSWKDARKFAGPLPFTFSVEHVPRRIVVIEGVRQNWSPRPVRVVEHEVPLVTSLTDATPTLASAFLIEKVPYWWKKGVIETWTG